MSDQPSEKKQIEALLLAFRNFTVSEDGEHAIFRVVDGKQAEGNIAVNWRDLSQMAQLLNQAGVEAAQKRLELGKSDDFTGVGAAQLVAKFAINDLPERDMRVLSLFSPSGLRSDYAISRGQKDQNGKSFIHSIAAALSE